MSLSSPPSRSLSLSPLVLVAALWAVSCGEAKQTSPSADSSAAIIASAVPLDVKLPLPSFELVDQSGARFSSADMRGKVWIVDFIFTSCPKICPDLTKKMSALVKTTEADADLRFLSISVDPENDTPAKLTEFVQKYGVVSPRWSLVTGDPKVIEETVLRGFKVAMGKDGAGNVFHGEYFVVVDREGRLRGFFMADEAGTKDLLERARTLAH